MPKSPEQSSGEQPEISSPELKIQNLELMIAHEASRNIAQIAKMAVRGARIMKEKGPRDRMTAWTGSKGLEDTEKELEEALEIIKEIRRWPR